MFGGDCGAGRGPVSTVGYGSSSVASATSMSASVLAECSLVWFRLSIVIGASPAAVMALVSVTRVSVMLGGVADWPLSVVSRCSVLTSGFTSSSVVVIGVSCGFVFGFRTDWSSPSAVAYVAAGVSSSMSFGSRCSVGIR